MAEPPTTADDSYTERGRAFWLPPGGSGNGLAARAWAQIAVVPREVAVVALAAFAQAGIAAHSDHAPGPNGYRDLSGASGYVLWVDPHRYSAATEVLMTVLRGPGSRGA